jgi:hypothetical protein
VRPVVLLYPSAALHAILLLPHHPYLSRTVDVEDAHRHTAVATAAPSRLPRQQTLHSLKCLSRRCHSSPIPIPTPPTPLDDNITSRASHCAFSTPPEIITSRATSSLIRLRRRCIAYHAVHIYTYYDIRTLEALDSCVQYSLDRRPLSQSSYHQHGVLIASRRHAASSSPDLG